MQLQIRGQKHHIIEVEGNESIAFIKVTVKPIILSFYLW